MNNAEYSLQVQGFLEKGNVSPAPLAKGLSFVQKLPLAKGEVQQNNKIIKPRKKEINNQG